MTLLSRFRILIGALLIAALFMAVGWRDRFPYSFPDLENYREGFQSGWYVFTVLNLGTIQFLINEGTWVFLFDDLWRQVGDIDISFFIISCTSVFLICFYICSRSGRLWPALFIFNPAVINLIIEQLRSGLATGLFFFGVLFKSWYLRAPFFILAISIHTAFIFFVLFFTLFDLAEKTPFGDKLRSRPAISLAIIVIFSVAAVYFRQSALTAIGDRRAFDVVEQSTGYLLFLGWALFVGTFFVTMKKNEKLEFEYYFFVMNLFMLFFSVLFQTYGSRFIAIAVPALAVMSRQIRPEQRIFFALHYAAFSAIYFFIWAN